MQGCASQGSVELFTVGRGGALPRPALPSRPAPPTHLWARRVLQASQAQEDEVAFDGGILGGVCQLLVPPVPLAAVVVRQVSAQLCLGGKGQQAQSAARQPVQQPARQRLRV